MQEETGRTFLVLTDRFDKFQTYMKEQYDIRVRAQQREVEYQGNRYIHATGIRHVVGLNPKMTTVIVLYGGRQTEAFEACQGRYQDIRYRETLP